MPHYLPISNPSKSRVRTGYEHVIAQRSRMPFAYAAKEDGEVIDVNEELKTVAIQYKTKGGVVLEYGSSVSKNGGGGFHVKQNVVTNTKIKKGHKFKEGEIIVYNSDFFSNDPYNDSVDLITGTYVNIALVQSSGAMEDASIITDSLSKKLGANPVRERTITITKDTDIHKIAMVGTKVKSIEPLMIFDETTMGSDMDMDEASLSALASLNRATPKAKYTGTVLKMKAFYRCEHKDMSTSVKSLVRAINKEAKAKFNYADSADNNDKFMEPGPMKGDKLDGKLLSMDDVVLKFYIEQDLGCGTGDKITYLASLKSVLSSVQKEDIVTEDGSIDDISAMVECASVQNRIVLGSLQTGVVERIMKGIEDNFLDIYFK